MFGRKKDDEPREGTFAQFRETQQAEGQDPSGSEQDMVDGQGPEDQMEGAVERNDGEGIEGSEELSRIVAELRELADQNYDKYIRAVADLENTKKRFVKERSDLIRYAGDGLAKDLLEVVDNLERALKQATPDIKEEFLAGLRMIHQSFVGVLDRHSIRGESAMGVRFDPLKHEALASVPTADVPAGTVLEEFKKAYFFKDKLLRAAQVVVATEVPSEQSEEAKAPSEESSSEDLGE